MIKRKKVNLAEANLEKKAIIACLKKQSKELRTILANAKLKKTYLILGFKSFDAYLKDCIATARIDMKPDYARKCANAGIVEMHILGEDKIGTMPEGSLRIFSENIDEVHWKPVLERAKNFSKDEYPTGQQIISAAKLLKVYKQEKLESNRPSRHKEKKINTNSKPLFNGTKGKGNKTFNTRKNNKPNVESDNKVSSSNQSKSKVVSINSLTSDKASKLIIKKYQPENIQVILGFLRAQQDDKLLNYCNYLINNCKEAAIKNLIKKLSQHLQFLKKSPKDKVG